MKIYEVEIRNRSNKGFAFVHKYFQNKEDAYNFITSAKKLSKFRGYSIRILDIDPLTDLFKQLMQAVK